jgi:GntR family negative regulator for fad regulon and positive regulator of fabA
VANARELRADLVERGMIERILDGRYPPGSELPGERVLCKEFGVARPALREALQRLSRDGWLEIQHGKSTKVVDLNRGATLSILAGMLKANARYFSNYVPDVLELWSVVAPDYAARAIERDSAAVLEMLQNFHTIEDRGDTTEHAMWQMHRLMIGLTGNRVYALMFNSFAELHRRLTLTFYRDPSKRQEAHHFWEALEEKVRAQDSAGGGALVGDYILSTYTYWKAAAIYEMLNSDGSLTGDGSQIDLG